MTEFVTIIGLFGLAVMSMWILPGEAKDVVVAVVSGLLGYLKGVSDGGKEKGQGQESKADRPGQEG